MTTGDALLRFLNPSLSVRARVDIADNPAAREDSSARADDEGYVCDVADGLLWVDFGRGAIPCTPDELEQ